MLNQIFQFNNPVNFITSTEECKEGKEREMN